MSSRDLGGAQTDEEGPNETEEESYQVIKTSKLRDKLRDEYDPQVSDESCGEMVEILNILTDKVWQEAVSIAERDNRATVEKRDVEQAYQQVLKAHNMIYEAIDGLEEAKYKLEGVADRSPFSTDGGKDDRE